MGFPFYLIAEGLALTVGTFYLKKGASLEHVYKSVWFFVVVSFLVDLLGTYMFQLFGVQNGWLYNLYDIYKYLAMAHILLGLVGLHWKYTGYYITLVILGAAGTDLIIANSYNDFLFYLIIIGDLILILLCLNYFRHIFLRPVYQSLVRLPNFWLVTGIFLCFLCMFPFHFFWNIITSDHFKHISGVLYNIIATISIFILYVSMSVFFLLCRFPIKR